MRPVIVVNIHLRIAIEESDYQRAYGPATKKEIREYVKSTVYEAASETVFPADIPVEVEEVR